MSIAQESIRRASGMGGGRIVRAADGSVTPPSILGTSGSWSQFLALGPGDAVFGTVVCSVVGSFVGATVSPGTWVAIPDCISFQLTQGQGVLYR